MNERVLKLGSADELQPLAGAQVQQPMRLLIQGVEDLHEASVHILYACTSSHGHMCVCAYVCMSVHACIREHLSA